MNYASDKYFKKILLIPKMNSTFSLMVLIISVILSLHPNMCLGSVWVCKPCKDETECNADPTDACPWGEVRDACDRRICAKGPGDRCGGPLDVLGQCGEGMMCSQGDERCHGCSLQTLQCYDGKFIS